jgi:two-component system, NarL family, nitrate/nitrite response regulator NarL
MGYQLNNICTKDPNFIIPNAINTSAERTMMQSTLTIKVLVVDDHTLTCELLSAYLATEGDMESVHADNVERGLELIQKKGPFDIVLVDLEMPGMNGMAGIERFIAAAKPGNVILFSGQARMEVALRAIEAGVKGFIPKTLPMKSLCNAVRFVAAGETYLPQSFTLAFAKPERRKRSTTISTAEKDVLKGICKGQTNKDIARELGLTEITIKMHVRSICSKLNVSNRTQIAMTAIAQGLI